MTSVSLFSKESRKVGQKLGQKWVRNWVRSHRETLKNLLTRCELGGYPLGQAEREEPPPFPLKCCISIAYKVKELSCTVSVPFFRTSTDPLQTIS